MRVAIISRSDRFGGGASQHAEDLAGLLEASGHTVHHWVGSYQGDYRPRLRILYGSHGTNWIRGFRDVSRRFGFPDMIPVELITLLRRDRFREYDLIHVHDISTAASPLTVRYLGRRLPVIWTFHDCSPFTGGCIYPFSCRAFESRCGACPRLHDDGLRTRFDRTGMLQDIKREMAKEDLYVPVAPSRWMQDQAMRSGMFQRPPEIIPYGVEIPDESLLDKGRIRRMLGLPDRPIVLFSSVTMDAPRKGLNYAIDALKAVGDLKPYLVVLGRPGNESARLLHGVDVRSFGYVSDARLVSLLYASADVHLFTSIADNLPFSILETGAAGTPTVGFATGGAPEMIEHEKTGYLVPTGNVESLIDGIRRALSDGAAGRWGVAAREKIAREFSMELMKERHLRLYGEVLERRRAAPGRTD